ncbi:MAG: hypothetical protein ACTS5G_02665 [Burkholderiales bacterium]
MAQLKAPFRAPIRKLGVAMRHFGFAVPCWSVINGANMTNQKFKRLLLMLLLPTITTITGCTTVISATPAMGASGLPAYWIEVVNGPRENALHKVRLQGEHLCRGQAFHIAREIEEDEKLSYVLRALVQCDASN